MSEKNKINQETFLYKNLNQPYRDYLEKDNPPFFNLEKILLLNNTNIKIEDNNLEQYKKLTEIIEDNNIKNQDLAEFISITNPKILEDIKFLKIKNTIPLEEEISLSLEKENLKKTILKDDKTNSVHLIDNITKIEQINPFLVYKNLTSQKPKKSHEENYSQIKNKIISKKKEYNNLFNTNLNDLYFFIGLKTNDYIQSRKYIKEKIAYKKEEKNTIKTYISDYLYKQVLYIENKESILNPVPNAVLKKIEYLLKEPNFDNLQYAIYTYKKNHELIKEKNSLALILKKTINSNTDEFDIASKILNSNNEIGRELYENRSDFGLVINQKNKDSKEIEEQIKQISNKPIKSLCYFKLSMFEFAKKYDPNLKKEYLEKSWQLNQEENIPLHDLIECTEEENLDLDLAYHYSKIGIDKDPTNPIFQKQYIQICKKSNKISELNDFYETLKKSSTKEEKQEILKEQIYLSRITKSQNIEKYINEQQALEE